MDFEELYAEVDGREERVVGLAGPFALIGGYGSWVGTRLLAGPLRVSSTRTLPAAIVVGVLAGLVAGALARWLVRRRLAGGEWRTGRPVVALCTVCGLLAGALLTWIEDTPWESTLPLGALVGAALSPLCAYVVRTAVHSSRARMGSMVAAAEQRSLLIALLGALLAASLVEVHEWFSISEVCVGRQAAQAWWGAHVGMVVAIGSAAAAGVALRRQRATWAQVAELSATSHWMAQGDAFVEGDPRRVDLGLGEVTHVRMGEGRTYRDAARPVGALVGDPDAALRTADRLVGQARGLLVLAMAVIGIHLVAASLQSSRAPVFELPPRAAPW